MQQFNKGAFNAIKIQSSIDNQEQIIEQEALRILKAEEKIEIHTSDTGSFPLYMNLILSILTSLMNRCHRFYPKNQKQEKDQFSVNIRLSLLKLIASIIQKKLYLSDQSQKYFDQISYSLLFKNYLFSLFITILAENTNFVTFQKILTFYQAITSEQYLFHVPAQLYHLYGGGVFTIDSYIFRQKLQTMINMIGKTLSSTETMITRNIQGFKKNKERNIVLEQSIKLVYLSKDKENLTKTVATITESIFKNKKYLKKEEFCQELISQKINSFLLIPIELLRCQFKLVQELQFQNNINTRGQVSKTNFYTAEMQKILNKCPFNGDQRCDCKKCQCVRRNRESAKLSQEKKRNAVQQLQPMRLKVIELQKINSQLNKKNKELQQENMVLKGLFNQLKNIPSFHEHLLEAVAPVSKVLYDQ